MKIEINKEEILRLIDKDALAEEIARQLIMSKKDHSFEEEFNSELLKGLEKAVERIVKEYIENYYAGQNIKSKVGSVLEKMSKEDIIKAISTKL